MKRKIFVTHLYEYVNEYISLKDHRMKKEQKFGEKKYAILRQNFYDVTFERILKIFFETSQELLEMTSRANTTCHRKKFISHLHSRERSLQRQTFTAHTRRINAEECLQIGGFYASTRKLSKSSDSRRADLVSYLRERPETSAFFFWWILRHHRTADRSFSCLVGQSAHGETSFVRGTVTSYNDRWCPSIVRLLVPLLPLLPASRVIAHVSFPTRIRHVSYNMVLHI